MMINLEDRAVHDHHALRVTHRPITNLPHPQGGHVVGEQHIREGHGVWPSNVPLPKRRLVPDVALFPRCKVLRQRIIVMVDPLPAAPLCECRTSLLGTIVKSAELHGSAYVLLLRHHTSPTIL